jgi:RND superfamily putative drug exporter
MLVITVGLLLAVLFKQGAFALVGIVGLIVVIVGSKTFAKGLANEVPRRKVKPREEQLWYRWSRVIQHRPWPALVAGLVVLLLLAIPVLSLRMGFGDTGNLKEDQTPRRAYDMLADGFGPGFNGPIIVTVAGPDAQDPGALTSFTDTLRDTPGVAATTNAIPVADDLALVQVYADSAPQDAATASLVHHLRDDVVPASGIDAKVGGFNAASVDFAEYLSGRLPYLIGAVLILSFILLMVVFRSLLVPLKAVIMNLLSIGAAYGVLVMLFQWGWLSDLTNIQPGPIEPWAPMILFAIVFGLSMDYEVFLLSRIREEWHHTGDSRRSVADGLAATAKVITAAAAIMVVVFGSFLFENDRSLKLMGVGLATAIFLDATIVRMVLVPATMELLGDKNWWLPRWLGRILPNIDVEGHAEHLSDDEEPEREPVGAGVS